ncbi:hypothetical protein [Blastomonas aquatica]|nr:hypothetical protein [Blastomonas aquatica]
MNALIEIWCDRNFHLNPAAVHADRGHNRAGNQSKLRIILRQRLRCLQLKIFQWGIASPVDPPEIIMSQNNDREYCLKRAAAARELQGSTTDPVVAGVHAEFAVRYELQAQQRDQNRRRK